MIPERVQPGRPASAPLCVRCSCTFFRLASFSAPRDRQLCNVDAQLQQTDAKGEGSFGSGRNEPSHTALQLLARKRLQEDIVPHFNVILLKLKNEVESSDRRCQSGAVAQKLSQKWKSFLRLLKRA